MPWLEFFPEAETYSTWEMCPCFGQQFHLKHFVKCLRSPILPTKGAAMGGHQLIQFDPSLSSFESALNHLQHK